MNPTEARERLRSAAGSGSGISSDITLDDAKKRFRETAAELDNKMGLNSQNFGHWAAALFFATTLLGAGKSRFRLAPLMTSVMSFGEKAFDKILGMFAHKPEQKKPRRAKKKQDKKP